MTGKVGRRLIHGLGGQDLGPVPGLSGRSLKRAREAVTITLSYGNNTFNVVRAYPADATFFGAV